MIRAAIATATATPPVPLIDVKKLLESLEELFVAEMESNGDTSEGGIYSHPQLHL